MSASKPYMEWLIFVAAIGAGLANPLQSAANAQLNKQLGQSLWATIIVYGTGLLGALVLQLVTHQARPSSISAGSVPWWAWLGGLISIVATIAGLTLAHRLGSGVFTGLTVTASVMISIALDHFGWLGFERHPASFLRVLGSVLMVGGVWLVSRF